MSILAIRTLYGWLRHGVAVTMTAVALLACPPADTAAAADDLLFARSGTDEAEPVAGTYLVVVNGNNRYSATDAEMMALVRRLCLKQQDTWPDARAAVPFGRPVGGPADQALRRLVLGMSVEALDAHWRRLNAATGAAPPRVIAETRELLRAIARADGAFGVVAADEAARLPAGVRVLFRFSLREVAGVISTERLFWQSIEGADDPAGFQAYLGAFPGGAYADLARARIDELTGAPPARLAAQEDAAVVASLPEPSGRIDADALENDAALERAIVEYFDAQVRRVMDQKRSGPGYISMVGDIQIGEIRNIKILTIADEIVTTRVKYRWQRRDSGVWQWYGKNDSAIVTIDTSGPSYRVLDFQSDEFPSLAAVSTEQATGEAAQFEPLQQTGAHPTEEDVVLNESVKKAIIDFYDEQKIVIRSNQWPAEFFLTNIDSIIAIDVLSISENIVTVDVKYSWVAGFESYSPRLHFDRGVATLEKVGSSYRVLSFETGGKTYEAVTDEKDVVTVGKTYEPDTMTSENLENDENLKTVLMQYFDTTAFPVRKVYAGFIYWAYINKIVDISVLSVSDDQAKINVKYRWGSYGSYGRFDHGIATVQKIGSSYRVLSFETGGFTYTAPVETAALAPLSQASARLTEEDILNDPEIKDLIMKFYDEQRVREKGMPYGGGMSSMAENSEMQSIGEMDVLGILGNRATVEIQYSWMLPEFLYVVESATGIATLERRGSTYRVVSFETAGMTYTAPVETAALTPYEPTSITVTEAEILADDGVKVAITEFYNQHNIKQRRRTSWSYFGTVLDSIVDLSVLNISGNVVDLAVNYTWSIEGSGVTTYSTARSPGVERATATLEKTGSSYRVLKFETGGLTYTAPVETAALTPLQPTSIRESGAFDGEWVGELNHEFYPPGAPIKATVINDTFTMELDTIGPDVLLEGEISESGEISAWSKIAGFNMGYAVGADVILEGTFSDDIARGTLRVSLGSGTFVLRRAENSAIAMTQADRQATAGIVVDKAEVEKDDHLKSVIKKYFKKQKFLARFRAWPQEMVNVEDLSVKSISGTTFIVDLKYRTVAGEVFGLESATSKIEKTADSYKIISFDRNQ